MAKVTPMMEQYFEIKNKYRHCLLFFRLGDFYELFFEDAVIGSRELGLTLTGKDWGQKERAPMCGVPFHSADSYIDKLVKNGYKVAICEQVEDPKAAKGIVKRDVIRIVTPGTVIDKEVLDENKNNYIMSIYSDAKGYALAVCDVTTGEFQTAEFVSANAEEKLFDEAARFNPAEIIANEQFMNTGCAEKISRVLNIKLSTADESRFSYRNATKMLMKHFNVLTLDGLGLNERVFCVCASGGLMDYLYETQKNNLEHISKITIYSTNDFMLLDANTRRNLELTETMREKNRKGSLLWVIDRTKTAMGARLLRKWVEQPLINSADINKRLDAVEELADDFFRREEVKEVLSTMHDFERIMSRIVYKTANARELVNLKTSIENLPRLKQILEGVKSDYLKEIYNEIDTLEDIFSLIDKAIVEDPPFSVREGGMIKRGYSLEADTLQEAKEKGSGWIKDLEKKEKEETGIKTLRINYNRVFGYYIEVSKSYMNQTPEKYVRKQTLTNTERYTTEELENLAQLILGSEEKLIDLEYNTFCEVREKVASQVNRIQYTAYVVAVTDALCSLADTAQAQNYVKPVVNDGDVIDIKDGRHPSVEKMSQEAFISNDVYLDGDENRLLIITGPNMAGKSTYMRQTAIITLLAQIGSFVPASEATIGVCDRIFTRVGASDDLASGQSTFMVEMTEVANILNNATAKSLLILDEIGRGTSTFDGLSIAWAVLEYIADKKQLGAKTLFATHYHELTELEGKLPGVKNYCITVKEEGEDIIFLRKIKRGGADHSYGVQVARLAGLPNKVIKRANSILKKLNAADIAKKTKKLANESKEAAEETAVQMDMFSMQETQLADEISKIDVMSLTPIQALQTLFDLQNKIKGM
ncbi:MAG: DNA mismatch repair protein MutS [Clostridiales bacterium]|nr:DNA mismatch repair protein MutS [Clostridiales bacterium]